MAATADILNILEKALHPEGFARLPDVGRQTTRWWKRLPMLHDPERHAALVVTIIPGRRLGQFVIVPELMLDQKPFSPQRAPDTFQGSVHDWIVHHLKLYPVLAEIEDFIERGGIPNVE